MILCRISTALNRRATGQDEPLCVTAARRGGWLRLALDVALYWYDGPDHCLRMRVRHDRDGWGVSDGLRRW
jgi:hypothetical protein